MAPISRLFGRKDDQPSPGKESASKASSQGAADDEFGLKFIFASGDSKVFTSLPISVGRGKQNDIVLDDESVSETHARIYYDEPAGDICILDRDSLNGLFIDDQPTRKNVLHDDVRIRVGRVELIFRDTGYIHSV
ncbi:MAG: FHA domain-containing protein [Anaerolineales bacterium]|nr:FHA domain-containing protein [Anaerolineales bacterium]